MKQNKMMMTMKEMMKRVKNKMDAHLDKMVDTGTPMTGQEAEKWRNGKYEGMD